MMKRFTKYLVALIFCSLFLGFNVGRVAAQTYCTPTYNYGCTYGDDISNVTLNGQTVNLNNSTTACNSSAYQNYTSLANPDLTIGMSYSISISTGYSFPASEDARAWIDYDDDGSFESGEEIANTNGAGLSSGGSNFTFTVPATASAGYRRMRVRVVYVGGSNINPCSYQNYGETEDYKVQVLAPQPCSSASFPSSVLASVDNDTLCMSGDIELDIDTSFSLTGISYQWQSGGSSSGPWTDIGSSQAASTKSITNVSSNSWYRCLVLCNSATAITSNVVSVSVNNPQLVSYSDTVVHCGSDSVTFTATASAGNTINWYDDAFSTTPLDTGNSFTTPYLTATEVYYVSAGSSGGSGNGVRITEMSANSGSDGVEIQNVSNSPVDVSGWRVAISGSYSSISSANSIVQTLSGTMQPGDIVYWTDGGTNYWGSNIYFTGSPSGKGWVILLDDNNEVVDFVCQGWTGSQVASASLNIPGGSISPGNVWTGAGLNGDAFQRKGSSDNDVASDWEEVTKNFGTTNINLNLPFGGLGGVCEGSRVPVVVEILPDVPDVDLGDDTVSCPGAPAIVLDAGTAGLNYLWSTSATSQTISVGSSGTYSVTVSNLNGCSKGDTINISVGTNPMLVLPDSAIFCTGSTYILDAGNVGATYLWNTNETTQSIVVDTSGFFSVVITSASNCTLSDSSYAFSLSKPMVDLGNDTAICADAMITLNAGNAGNSFMWNTGDTTQMITVADSGVYWVSVLVPGGNGCNTVDSIFLTVNPLPTDVLPDTSNLCETYTVTLDAENAGSSYLWSNSATTQSITVGTPGNYSVMVTSMYGCVKTFGTYAVLRPNPIVDLMSDTNICAGDAVVLDPGNQPLGSSFMWNTGDSTQSITVSGSGLYIVVVENKYGCTSTDQMHIDPVALPFVEGINETHNMDATYTFSASILQNRDNVVTYQWFFGDGNSSTDKRPTHLYAEAGDYIVTLIITDICGNMDTTIKHVRLSATGVGEITLNQSELELYPNPAQNWVILKNESTLKMASVQVYNVLGQVVYRAKTENTKTYRLQTQHYASGMYQVRITFENGRWLNRKFEVRQ